jgi:hypothetical protein
MWISVAESQLVAVEVDPQYGFPSRNTPLASILLVLELFGVFDLSIPFVYFQF